MLAHSGPLPTGPGWRFEPKLDGFRCRACTHGGRLRVRSRRGWDIALSSGLRWDEGLPAGPSDPTDLSVDRVARARPRASAG